MGTTPSPTRGTRALPNHPPHPAEVSDLSYNAPTKTRELFCKSWLDFPAWKKTGALGSALVLRRNAQNILQGSHLCEVADARISTRLGWYFPTNSQCNWEDRSRLRNIARVGIDCSTSRATTCTKERRLLSCPFRLDG